MYSSRSSAALSPGPRSAALIAPPPPRRAAVPLGDGGLQPVLRGGERGISRSSSARRATGRQRLGGAARSARSVSQPAMASAWADPHRRPPPATPNGPGRRRRRLVRSARDRAASSGTVCARSGERPSRSFDASRRRRGAGASRAHLLDALGVAHLGRPRARSGAPQPVFSAASSSTRATSASSVSCAANRVSASAWSIRCNTCSA